jgi:hypothetical protein
MKTFDRSEILKKSLGHDQTNSLVKHVMAVINLTSLWVEIRWAQVLPANT